MLLTTLATAVLLAPTSSATPDPTPGQEHDHGKLAWFDGSFEELMAKAAEEKKIVFLDFWTDWCVWCKRLDKDTFSAESVVGEMKDVLCFNVDAESREGAPIARKYGVTGYPTLIFLEPDGEVRDLISGYLPAEPFVVEVKRIKRNEGTLSGLRAGVEANPDDLDLRYEYAKKLQAVRDLEGYNEQLAAIRERDPEGATGVGHRLHFDQLYDDIYRAMTKGSARKLEPMVAFLQEEQDGALLFTGWSLIATVHDFDALGLDTAAKAMDEAIAAAKERGDEDKVIEALVAKRAAARADAKGQRTQSRAAFVAAWPHTPEDQVSVFGNQIAWAFWTARDDLSEDEKRWALEVAQSASKAVDDGDFHILDTLACCYFMNGLNEQALEQVAAGRVLDPENEMWDKRVAEFTPEG